MTSRRRILIVDDSQVMLEATQLTLEDAGFQVLTLDNPLVLPSVVRREEPDLVLLDFNMPSIRGDEVAAIIKRMGVDVGNCVVLFSDAHDLEGIAARAGAAGAIAKSTAPEQLADRVREFLSKKR